MSFLTNQTYSIMKKLKLNELKVDSFVTRLSNDEQANLKGGTTPLCSLLASLVISAVKDGLDDLAETPTKTGSTRINASPCPATRFQTKGNAGTCAHAHCHCVTD